MTEMRNTMQNNLRRSYSVIVADHVPGLSGPSEKHDLPVRTWHLPNVRRPDVGVSNMSQGGRQTYSTLLKIKDCHLPTEIFRGQLDDGFQSLTIRDHFAKGNIFSRRPVYF